MKIRETLSVILILILTLINDLDLDECYPGHSEQYSRGFSHQSDTLRNANAGGTVTFQCYNSEIHEDKVCNQCFENVSISAKDAMKIRSLRFLC